MNEFRYIVAGNTDALLVELSNLHTGETAYITANEFERITGADLNEFSTAGRRLIGDMAAQSWCTIRVADGRIFFKKKSAHLLSAPRRACVRLQELSKTSGRLSTPGTGG